MTNCHVSYKYSQKKAFLSECDIINDKLSNL